MNKKNKKKYNQTTTKQTEKHKQKTIEHTNKGTKTKKTIPSNKHKTNGKTNTQKTTEHKKKTEKTKRRKEPNQTSINKHKTNGNTHTKPTNQSQLTPSKQRPLNTRQIANIINNNSGHSGAISGNDTHRAEATRGEI